MHHLVYTPQVEATYPVCLLVPQIKREDIYKAYLDQSGLPAEEVIVFDLHQGPGKKTPMAEIKAYITEELMPVINEMQCQYILCADADYFKAFTKAAKVEANLGYMMDSVFGSQKVVYVPNYKAIFYDPDAIKGKIQRGITALIEHATGSYQDPGNEVIKFAEYPQTDAEIEEWLIKLLDHKALTSDIEAFSLKHYDAGIGTITFCWNKHEGIAFPVDYQPVAGAIEAPYGMNIKNEPRRRMLRRFFELCHEMDIKLIWHSIGYDVYVLIYQLFMDHILDQEGLLYGMKIMLGDEGNWDCTKLITYLATNSCAGNKLGLKDQAQEFSGNYAVEEIKDITRIPLDQLLQYNLVDGLSTWYVHDKHYPTMVTDEQLPVYQELFQPSMVDIIQMQLTGMPVNMKTVLEVEQELLADESKALAAITSSKTVQRYTYRLMENHVRKRNEKLKTKRISMDDEETKAVTFNPNSSDQLQELLFDFLHLPILGYTKNKQPGTDGETIKNLKNHTTDPDILAFLSGLVDYKAVNKIITDFIPSLKNAQLGNDNWHYLFGNFNLGGTKSGRLSSSGPNLQNLPANSKYAKLIKRCFEAPPGWIFAGLDFSSLEDRISALTTKDPNKIKVYTDGYDGHCLRAYAYFGESMPDIDPNSVESINSVAKKYKPERQDSKVPTFALTYMGTFITLMKNCGFSEEKAKLIEQRYHELYHVSDEWVDAKLEQASQVGYVTVAFRLRLRTPMLAQVIRGNSRTPHQATAEGRTAGNALGQSYCLLNSRAGTEFNSKVRKSEFKLNIRPCAQIHDAQYFLIKDDIKAVAYTNEHLVKAVQWQDDPAIAHDQVKLGGELSIFWPTWNDEIVIPNHATEAQIFSVIDQHMS